MNGIIIRRPSIEEVDLLNAFFEMVLKDTFEKNEYTDLKDLLEEEIQEKNRCIHQDFESNGRDRFFLIAEYQGRIIGSIEYGPSNELIEQCTNNELKDMLEIGTVFVHPDYQRQGLSALLFYQLFCELDKRRVDEICFDSGYKIAQSIWSKRFGRPQYYLKDYWGEDRHHMVWRVKVKDVLERNRPENNI